ncbi:MAG: hypothetical protein ACNA7O_03210 [Rhodobacterales bacterium]
MSDQDHKRPKEDIHPVMDPPQPPERDDNGLVDHDRDHDRDKGAGDKPHRQPARPDPRTGEVPAGPGDAGLEDRPALNQGSPGTRQMSNRRVGTVVGIALVLAAATILLASVF